MKKFILSLLVICSICGCMTSEEVADQVAAKRATFESLSGQKIKKAWYNKNKPTHVYFLLENEKIVHIESKYIDSIEMIERESDVTNQGTK